MANLPGHLTEEEIRAQPHLWAEVLRSTSRHSLQLTDLWRASKPDQVLLTGCGSSYYLADSAAHLLQAALRVPCRAAPSSEIVFAGEAMQVWPRPPLLIAVSRSGETTETVWALRRLRALGAPTIAVSCSAGGALSSASDLAITLPVNERSVVMTGSFTSMLLTLAAIAATLSGDWKALNDLQRAPDLAACDMPVLDERARVYADAVPHSYVYLGSGPLYGIAREGALKMTEMALVTGCAYHTLEFLHGPKAAVSPQTVVVGLLSSQGVAYEGRVLKHLADLGALVIAVGTPVDSLPTVRLTAEPGTVPAMLLAGLWMQFLALYVARARGADPDAPRFLQPVVTWDELLQSGGAR